MVYASGAITIEHEGAARVFYNKQHCVSSSMTLTEKNTPVADEAYAFPANLIIVATHQQYTMTGSIHNNGSGSQCMRPEFLVYS